MRLIPALTLCVLLAGCSTAKASKCSALRAHFEDTVTQFDRCMDRLSVHGDESVCSDAAAAPGKATAPALGACSAAAQEAESQATKKE